MLKTCNESAEDMLLALRAKTLLQQRTALLGQRRAFQRIKRQVQWEAGEAMRDGLTLEGMGELAAALQRRLDALDRAVEQTDAALAKNGQALGAPVRDPFTLIEHKPAELIETEHKVSQRRADRKYRAGLRVVSAEAA